MRQSLRLVLLLAALASMPFANSVRFFSPTWLSGVVAPAPPNTHPTTSTTNATSFEVLSQRKVYDGWRKVMKKDIRFPNSKVVSFDVLTNPPAISILAWDSQTATATLIQEFHPGVERLMYGVVAGGFEAHKHDSVLKCAAYELEEEAHLSSNTMIPLLSSADGSVPFEKYSDQMLFPFLALDCSPVANPKPIDDEEFIVIHKGITYPEIMGMIARGEMNTLSTYTCLLAFNKLREMGIPLTLQAPAGGPPVENLNTSL